MTQLTISHIIHLSDEDIDLLISGKEVIVTGVCSPVTTGKNYCSEPAYEVFCEYNIKVGYSSFKSVEKGFVVSLSNYQLNELRENRWMSLMNSELKKKLVTFHQIIISGKEDLERSICFDHLSQISSS